ncbi:hypothetical protein E9531_03670 [Lampropedia puyangensis]|uniref:Uncharacterized protein n=1 Tax=Lampropedia puyangensis TaxID=1330072 RepID=A0A4S8FA77_9BURK|nr:hypothetical protein [Lampropedia puyangensis]THU04498.1 hypothetical protein E9531_03670 [Lampropedia puyangensis]
MATPLTLGLRGLPQEEVILIKTIFRLSSQWLSPQWSVVDDGPVDVCIADSSSWNDDVQQELSGVARIPTLYLSRASNPEIDAVLMRPIRADALVQWLLDTARQLETARKAEKTTQTRATTAAHTRVPALEMPSHAEAYLDHDSRYLLRRWPPAQIIGNDPKRLRITSLLSKQALQVNELSSLSGASLDECEEWVSTLLHSELLDTRVGSKVAVISTEMQSSGVPARYPSASVLPAGQPPKRGLGLMRAIRRRLGI